MLVVVVVVAAVASHQAGILSLLLLFVSCHYLIIRYHHCHRLSLSHHLPFAFLVQFFVVTFCELLCCGSRRLYFVCYLFWILSRFGNSVAAGLAVGRQLPPLVGLSLVWLSLVLDGSCWLSSMSFGVFVLAVGLAFCDSGCSCRFGIL